MGCYDSVDNTVHATVHDRTIPTGSGQPPGHTHGASYQGALASACLPTTKSKIMQQVQEADFQYLRQVSPPIDPDILEAQYGLLLQRPKSPPTAHTCRFRPENITDTRVRQWAWWEALSKVKVYVREYYMYTRWAARANATATGTPVQEFVRTHHGTVTLVPHDTRIVVANHNRQLHVQIASGFEPWGPNTDMANRGRVPVYVANTMQYHSTRNGFQ